MAASRGKTRLSPGQLRHLAGAIRTAPVLETLTLVSVSMTMEFGRTNDQNPFVSSLRDPQYSVLRLEVSVLEYPELWGALMRAKKDRMKGKGKGGGKGKRNEGKGQGKGKADKGGARGSVIKLPASLTVRLKDLSQTHPDRSMRVLLSTDEFSITADIDVDSMRPSRKDIARTFVAQLACKTRVEATLSTLSGKSVKN